MADIRTSSSFCGASLRSGDESLQCLELADQRALLDRLERSYLVVQGPPGSGKTYRGARLITHLIRQGRKVGIVAQSHKVIHNLIDAIEQAAGRGRSRLPWRQVRREVRDGSRKARRPRRRPRP